MGKKLNKKEFCSFWNSKPHSVHFCSEAGKLLLRKKPQKRSLCGAERPSYMWFLKVNRSSVVAPEEQLWHMLKLQRSLQLSQSNALEVVS